MHRAVGELLIIKWFNPGKLKINSKRGSCSSTDVGETFEREMFYIREKRLWAPVASCLKSEAQKCSWNGLLVSFLGFAALQLIASLFTTHSCSDVSPAACCASCSDSQRGSQNYKRFYLFIYFSSPSSILLLCFSKLTNVLELIEYDPPTAVWNNEASFPHIFSHRMASLSCTSVNIKVPYQCGIWGWRNYWSHWEPEPPYLLLLHWGSDGIMEPKAMLSQPGDNGWTLYGCVVCLACFLLF